MFRRIYIALNFLHVKLEIFMEVKINIVVFWVMTRHHVSGSGRQVPAFRRNIPASFSECDTQSEDSCCDLLDYDIVLSNE
jgi:hypothetical protein